MQLIYYIIYILLIFFVFVPFCHGVIFKTVPVARTLYVKQTYEYTTEFDTCEFVFVSVTFESIFIFELKYDKNEIQIQFHPNWFQSLLVHHERKSRVAVSLWSPSCLFLLRKGPFFLVPRLGFFPFFTDKGLLFRRTTSIPITEQSSSSPSHSLFLSPAWPLGLSSFLPTSFSWGPVIGAPRSVSRSMLHAGQRRYKNRLRTPVSWRYAFASCSNCFRFCFGVPPFGSCSWFCVWCR